MRLVSDWRAFHAPEELGEGKAGSGPAASHQQDKATPARAAGSLTRRSGALCSYPEWDTLGAVGPEPPAAPALPTAPPLKSACGPAPPAPGGARPPGGAAAPRGPARPPWPRPQAPATPLAPPPVGFVRRAPCGAQRLRGVLASDASRVVTGGARLYPPGAGLAQPCEPLILAAQPSGLGSREAQMEHMSPRKKSLHFADAP